MILSITLYYGKSGRSSGSTTRALLRLPPSKLPPGSCEYKSPSTSPLLSFYFLPARLKELLKRSSAPGMSFSGGEFQRRCWCRTCESDAKNRVRLWVRANGLGFRVHVDAWNWIVMEGRYLCCSPSPCTTGSGVNHFPPI
jgi:hypothetical protein